MIVCGPILMQQYNGEGSNPRNNFVCWIGAFMLSMPMVFLVIICITMVFKSFFKRK
jgi:hypothetical protein